MDLTEDDERRHPVTSGLTALVSVGLAVGLFLGVVAFVGVKVLGIGGGTAQHRSTQGASLYLPSPTDSHHFVAPEISIAPAGEPADAYSAAPGDTLAPGATPPAGTGLTLSTPQTSVGAGQRIELTGVGPDGHVLTVQRLEGTSWVGFAGVQAHVRGGTYQTWVQTSQPGAQQWRMGDPATGAVSNPVTVTVG